MAEIPQELNWVEARHACSLTTVLEQLKAGAESDVKHLNHVKNLEPQFAFTVQPIYNGFLVARRPDVEFGVRFLLAGGHIEIVYDVDDTKHRATVVLTADGRCKIRIDDGEELEQWQVRRMVLESLLFTS